MAAIGAYLAQQILDVSLRNGASFVAPTDLALGLSIGVPTSLSMSEYSGTLGLGYAPQSVTFSSVSTGGSLMEASNANAMTFSFAMVPGASTVIGGGFVKNSLSGGNAGTPLYFGGLASPITVSNGDMISWPPGSLTIALS